MKKALVFLLALCLSSAVLVNCSSDDGGSPAAPPAESHDTEVSPEAAEVTDAEPVIAEPISDDGRLTNTTPNTGLGLSYVNGDFNIVDVQQILVFDFGANITRVVSENRYFLQNGNSTQNVGCDVFYYANDNKSLEQIAAENEMSIQQVLVEIASGNAGQKFGGSYNPDGQWFFRASFVENTARCSESIAASGLMDEVRAGRASLRYFQESWDARDEMNSREL